jgi:hypothetical protein
MSTWTCSFLFRGLTHGLNDEYKFLFVLMIHLCGCPFWFGSSSPLPSISPLFWFMSMISWFLIWNLFDWNFFGRKVAGTSWNLSKVILCPESKPISKSLEIWFWMKTPIGARILWIWSWSFDLLILIFWDYLHGVKVVLCLKFELHRSSFGRFSNPGAVFGVWIQFCQVHTGSTGLHTGSTGLTTVFLFWLISVAFHFRLSFLLPHLLRLVPS